jgi:hypothetical protein
MATKITGVFIPDNMADADAPNNCIYYSTTQNKLVYKDKDGNTREI